VINKKSGNDDAQREKAVPVLDEAVTEPFDKIIDPVFHRFPAQTGLR